MSQRINLNTTPNQFMPILYFSQGDIGRTFEIALTSSDGYSIPSGATVEMVATKPSGFGFTVSGSLTDNVATFVTTETMTSEWGRFPAEIVIKNNGDVIGTANFYLNGERNPHPEGTIDGDASTIIPQLTLLVERVETAASSVLDRQTVTQTLPAGSQASYSFDEETNTQTFGIPQGEAGAGAVDVTASAYSSSKTYAVGDYVIHNDYLYRCTTAITTAEAWTSGHWTQVALANDVSDLKADLGDIDYGSLTDGYFSSTGGIDSASSMAEKHMEKYIAFNPNENVEVDVVLSENKSMWARWCYYDKNKGFISSYSTTQVWTNHQTYAFTMPSNAYYMRFSLRTHNVLSSLTVKRKDISNIVEENLDDLREVPNTYASLDLIGQSYLPYTPFVPWGTTDLTFFSTDADGVLTITGSSNVQRGVKTSLFEPDGNSLCEISFDWATTSGGSNYFRTYLYGNGGTMLTSAEISTAESTGTYTVSFDPSEAYIYHNETQFFLIMRFIVDGYDIEISNFKVSQNKMIGDTNDADDVISMIKNVSNDITTLDATVQSITTPELLLKNPSGDGYYVNLNASNQITLVRQYPKKALFCGNSLMFGWAVYSGGDYDNPTDASFGMCSTNNTEDYFYKITTQLATLDNDFTASKLYVSPFESAENLTDRQTFITNKLTPKLSADLDLVSIQCGDNVTTDARKANFYEGMELFIQAIRTNSPNARISWMAEWYENASISTIMSICKKYGVKFIPILDLAIDANKGTLGDTITYPDSTTTTVQYSSQASHPGNRGMSAIANRYLYQMGYADDENTYPL